MARASAATIPSVDPSQVPKGSAVVASVIVANIVLSPNSARKNAALAATIAECVLRSARLCSSSSRWSPWRVHAAKPRKARPAARVMAVVGRLAPRRTPAITENAWTTAVARVMPMRMGSGR